MDQQQHSSAGAFWSLLWRSVTYFPLAMGGFVLALSAFAVPVVLFTWAVEFALIGEWPRVAAAVLAMAAWIALLRRACRWYVKSPPAPAGESGDGSGVLL